VSAKEFIASYDWFKIQQGFGTFWVVDGPPVTQKAAKVRRKPKEVTQSVSNTYIM